MRCGAKCFLVQMEVDGELKTKSVNARTPAGARKIIRSAYGNKIDIQSVREK